MSKVLIIGAGGVGTVVAHKVAASPVFSEIMLASRTKSKADDIAAAVGGDRIKTARVDADSVEELTALMRAFRPDIVINVALPTLSAEFGISPSSSIWMVNAYQLVTAISLLSFASLGDLYGYKRVFLTGIAGFTAGSLLCAMAGSFKVLIITRVIQGLGAACIMSVNTALLRLIYPPEHLGRGMALNAMVVAVSATAGPSVAGAILTFVSWHWLFLINIPFAIAAFVIGNIVWRLVLCGLGFGLFQTPNNFTIVSSAPRHRSGGASGMLGTARLLGQTLGTSLVALLLRLYAHGEAVQLCLLLAGCCALAASFVSCLRLSQPAPNRKES